VSEELEHVAGPVPGPRSRELAERLRTYESRGVTYLSDDFPIFWESAHGALVTDVDGNRYIDLTSAFGVATLGHTHPRVVEAIGAQSRRLVHGLGDVHPTRVRADLLAALARLAPGDLSKGFLCSSGSEAVDFALKTAFLKVRRPAILAFHGSYHGLGGGALSVTGIERFRAPFAPFVRSDVTFVPFPAPLHSLEMVFFRQRIGTVVVEPIQGRAGVVVPPRGWLPGLRALCDRYGAVLIFDEIYTGFGRTGAMFACEHEGVVPDLLCVGKAIASGVPLAAVVGTPAVMDAWEPSGGEALHTSTYLGNPLACAAALATLSALEREGIVARAAELGVRLGRRLAALREKSPQIAEVRGRGMLWALQLPSAAAAFALTKAALRLGVIVLPTGVHGDAIALSPSIAIGEGQLMHAVDLLEQALERLRD
jgi:4-aminobutyrate aminotransferase-like enzyme